MHCIAFTLTRPSSNIVKWKIFSGCSSQPIDALCVLSHNAFEHITPIEDILIIIMWIYSFKWSFFSVFFFLAIQMLLVLRSFRRNKVSFRFTSNTFYWLQFQHYTHSFTKNVNCLNDTKCAHIVFINAIHSVEVTFVCFRYSLFHGKVWIWLSIYARKYADMVALAEIFGLWMRMYGLHELPNEWETMTEYQQKPFDYIIIHLFIKYINSERFQHQLLFFICDVYFVD